MTKTIGFMILWAISFNAKALEPICEKNNFYAEMLQMRAFIGVIPINNEYKNKYFLPMKKALVPAFEELCAEGKPSKTIVNQMRNKCMDLAKKAPQDVEAYMMTCDFIQATANAYLSGVEKTSECENKEVISDLSRRSKDIARELSKDEEQSHKSSDVKK